MRGLDPRIHLTSRETFSMDCRVKPGNDESDYITILAAFTTGPHFFCSAAM